MIPGTIPTIVGAGTPKVSSISFFDSSTDGGNSTGSLSVPAGIQTNDLFVLYERRANAGSTVPAEAVPSGFTLIGSAEVAPSARVIYSYKIATGLESSIPFISGSDGICRILAVFRPVGLITTVSPNGYTSQTTDGNPSSQTVPSGSGVPPLIVFGSYINHTGSTVDPRTMSPAKDGEISHTNWFWLAYKIYDSSPANVSVDMDDEGSANQLASFYLSLS